MPQASQAATLARQRFIRIHRLCAQAKSIIAGRVFNAFCKSPRARRVLVQAFGHNCAPLAIAKRRTTLLPRVDVEAIMELSELSIKQAARGELSHDSFSMLRTAWSIAHEIERCGEIRGFAQDIASTDAALNSIYGRCMNDGVWTAKACTAAELTTLKNFAALHRFQVSNILMATLQKISTELQQGTRTQGAAPAMNVADEIGQMRKTYGSFDLHIPKLVAA